MTTAELAKIMYPLFNASGPELMAHPDQAQARLEAQYRSNRKVRAHFGLTGPVTSRPPVPHVKPEPTAKAPKPAPTPTPAKSTRKGNGGSPAFWEASARTALAHLDAASAQRVLASVK